MDKYVFKKVLGEGSYGTVFLIQDNKKNSYALKRVTVDPFKTQESLKEIQVMQKFIHPNLVRIDGYKVIDNGEKIQIYMEYCEGGDLLDYYKRKEKNLSVEEILSVFRQIVKAFISLNVKGVMHRDLKPENVLLKSDITVKIADFGCARSVCLNDISKLDSFSLDKGTPIYSSPQLLTNAPYSAKCDVWSAGSMLYFFYFGQHPFMDSSVQNTLKKIQYLTEGKRIQLRQDCDPTIRALLHSTLIYEDKQRASWRQLWLSRYFCPKVADVESFLIYLQSISNIANWIVKQFWQTRKTMDIQASKCQLFAYFTIKFQFSNALLCYEIASKNLQYQYLFQPQAYKNFKSDKQQKLIKQIRAEIASRKQYFLSIKQKMSKKQCFSQIQKKQTKRTSMFADLDNSIRSAFKILTEIKDSVYPIDSKKTINNSGSLSLSTSNSFSNSNKPVQLIWLMMARWMNFEFWFSYERHPRIQNFLSENGSGQVLTEQILIEIDKYNYGVVQ